MACHTAYDVITPDFGRVLFAVRIPFPPPLVSSVLDRTVQKVIQTTELAPVPTTRSSFLPDNESSLLDGVAGYNAVFDAQIVI
jgi:hypothetical protein